VLAGFAVNRPLRVRALAYNLCVCQPIHLEVRELTSRPAWLNRASVQEVSHVSSYCLWTGRGPRRSSWPVQWVTSLLPDSIPRTGDTSWASVPLNLFVKHPTRITGWACEATRLATGEPTRATVRLAYPSSGNGASEGS
jgi:hypothetical protein